MKRKRMKHETSPVRHLQLELLALRRELRTTSRAYISRLESELRSASEALKSYAPTEELSREQLHRVRDFSMMVRKRRLKPDKGRRKDLRKIDCLISELHPLVANEAK